MECVRVREGLNGGHGLVRGWTLSVRSESTPLSQQRHSTCCSSPTLDRSSTVVSGLFRPYELSGYSLLFGAHAILMSRFDILHHDSSFYFSTLSSMYSLVYPPCPVCSTPSSSFHTLPRACHILIFVSTSCCFLLVSFCVILCLVSLLPCALLFLVFVCSLASGTQPNQKFTPSHSGLSYCVPKSHSPFPTSHSLININK